MKEVAVMDEKKCIRAVDEFCSRFFGANFNVPITICDPCCGEGAVIEVFKTYAPKAITYGVEAEYSKAIVANKRVEHFFNMDFHSIKRAKEMFNFVYLNVPTLQKSASANTIFSPLREYLNSWAVNIVVGGHILLVLDLEAMGQNDVLWALYSEGFAYELGFSYEGMCFALFKRGGTTRKYDCYEEFASPLYGAIPPLDEVKIPKQNKFIKINSQNKFFTSTKSLKVWQLIDFAEKRTNHPFKRKIKEYESSKNLAIIDSPNDGQALLMLLSGQLDKPIADNFLLKGTVKKKSVKRQVSKTKAKICDYYSSQLFCYDIAKNKYFKLS